MLIMYDVKIDELLQLIKCVDMGIGEGVEYPVCHEFLEYLEKLKESI